MSILKLIRWKNLVMIGMVQLLVKYAFLEPLGAAVRLDTTGIIILILATMCIAAAGNIINDIYDVETDFENKPNKLIIGKTITEEAAYNWFLIFNIVGVGLGFYLSNIVNKSAFFSLFVITSALLYMYATYLKQTVFFGNLVISILVGLSVLIVGFFELIPSMNHLNRDTQLAFFKVIFHYSLFAFAINLIREIVKDIEDFKGDSKAGIQTFPVRFGIKKATHFVFILTLILALIVVFYVNETLYKNLMAVLYFLIFIIGPLVYVAIKLLTTETKKDLHQVSNLLKIIMLFGMLSLLLYKYILI